MRRPSGTDFRRAAFVILSILFLLFPSTVFAADFHSWDTVVTLDEDGTGTIETTWVSTEKDGTEKYIVIDHLSPEMELYDFKVRDERGEYTFEEGDWNVHRSRNEKAMRCGIHESGSAKELCWGYGEYGTHTYTIHYKIKNLVHELRDADALNFMFLNRNMSEYPKHVSLEIHGTKPFSKEDTKMWAFGFEGEVKLTEEGVIRVDVHKKMDTDGHLTVFLTFPKGFFHPTMMLEKSVEDVIRHSMEESSYDEDIALGKKEIRHDESPYRFVLIPVILLGINVFFGRVFRNIGRKTKPKIKYRGEYYHEIPYPGPFYDIIYLLHGMGASDSEFLSAFFLKWVMDERIRTTESTKKSIFGKVNTAFEILREDDEDMGEKEAAIWSMFLEASGIDRVLDPKEFDRYVSKRHTHFRNTMNALVKSSEIYLKKMGFLETKPTRFLRIPETVKTEEGKKLEDNLYRFKNYLMDYSLLSEQKSVNVHIWDQFMIYAATFGILEEVYREFSKLYPEYQERTHFSPEVIYYTNFYAERISHAARKAREVSYTRSSLGSGGRSSFRGGGGSFGGGSGGGSR